MIKFEDLQKKYADLLSICFNICEETYRYFSTLSEDELASENIVKFKSYVDAAINDNDFKDYLQHKYIIKDKFQTEDPFENLELEIDEKFVEDEDEWSDK